MLDRFKENKTKIYLVGSLAVLAVTTGICLNNNKLEPQNVGATIENTKDESNKPNSYPEFNGEDIDLSQFIGSELNTDENGTNYFPNKTVEDVVNAFINATEKVGFINKTAVLEQNLRYNSVTGSDMSTKLVRTLTSCNESLDEYIEMSVYTDGKTGVYATNIVLDVKAQTWERSNEIFDIVLTELNIDKDLHEALLKSDEYFVNTGYDNSDSRFTFNLKRDCYFSCNTSLIITHNTDDIESNTVYRSESLENFDSIVADFDMIQSSKYEYSYLFSDNTFGKDVLDIVMQLMGKEYSGGIADATFKGVKGTSGERYSEEFNFVNTAISSDGELEVVVALNYLNGAVNVELDINNLKEDFTEEEKAYCRNVLIDFVNVVYEDCNLTDVSDIDGPYSKDTTTVTDASGNQYTISYGEVDNAFMINYIISDFNENSRSSDFKTYQ